MYRRGQVLIFVLIGILLVGLFAGVYFLVEDYAISDVSSRSGDLALSSRAGSSLVPFVEKCMRDVAVPGIYLAAAQGGVIYPDDKYYLFMTERGYMGYAFIGDDVFLSRKSVEMEIEGYMERELPLCVAGFDSFKEQGIVVEEKGEIEASTRINDAGVVVRLKFPLVVEQGGDKVEIDSFEVSVPLRLGMMIDEVDRLRRHLEENSARAYQSSRQDFFISTFPYDEMVFVYSIVDNGSVIDGAPLMLMVAADMMPINTAPEISPVLDIVVKKGAEAVYLLRVVDREENVVAVTSSNSMVKVDDEGILRFGSSSVGSVSTVITARDSFGLEGSQKVIFHVVE